jgi:hypothetical protein
MAGPLAFAWGGGGGGGGGSFWCCHVDIFIALTKKWSCIY